MSVPADVEAKLTEGRHSLHLATCVDGRPHVAPVWYAYEDGSILLLTGGKKLANLRENPRVACSIEHADEQGVHWHVSLLGTARLIEDPERVREGARKVFARYDPEFADSDVSGPLVEIRVGSVAATSY